MCPYRPRRSAIVRHLLAHDPRLEVSGQTAFPLSADLEARPADYALVEMGTRTLPSAMHVYLTSPVAVCTYVRQRPSGLSLWWSTSSRVIFNRMDRAIITPACVLAWLLCAVLVCLVVHPPPCDLCDGSLTGISSSPQIIVNQQLPAPPDPCNGICWCCGFHGLPNASPDLSSVNTVTSNVWLDPLSPVFAPRKSIYRPPRTDASS